MVTNDNKIEMHFHKLTAMLLATVAISIAAPTLLTVNARDLLK